MVPARAAATASAPGKLILFGEHVCVYGYTAVAASISDLRILVQVSLHDDGKSILDASLLDLPSASPNGGHVAACIRLDELSAALKACPDPIPPWWHPAPPSTAQVEALSALLTQLPAPDETALLPLLFLSAALLPQVLEISSGTSVRVRVRSADLPVGSGLGSSAAFSVSLAAALLRLQLQSMPPLRGEPGSRAALGTASPVDDPPAGLAEGTVPDEATRQVINGWAYAAECLLHGKPSGLDNAVSCAGEAMKLSKKDASAPMSFEPLPGFPRLRVLLTNTHVPRKTADLVQRVRELHDAPTTSGVVRHIFEAVASASECFLALVADGKRLEEGKSGGRHAATSLSPASMRAVGALIRMNHKLLDALQVSAPALEHVVSIAQGLGLPTKLTGAGGGGCAFSLLDGDDGGSAGALGVQARRSLEAAGYTCYVTHVGGHGVLWHRTETFPDRAPPARSYRRHASLLLASIAAVLAITVAARKRVR